MPEPNADVRPAPLSGVWIANPSDTGDTGSAWTRGIPASTRQSDIYAAACDTAMAYL